MDNDLIKREVGKTLTELQARGDVEEGIEAEEARTHCCAIQVRLCQDDEHFILSMPKDVVNRYLATLGPASSSSQSAKAAVRHDWEERIRQCCVNEQAHRAQQ